jgi:hypothetical protein
MTAQKHPDPDDLLSLCGVTLEPQKERRAKPREEPKRFTNWSNLHTFSFGGYAARVTRVHCTTCDSLRDHLEGIFVVEIHLPSGTRRLTALAKGADWPAQGGHAKEVTQVQVPVCGECIGGLGFDREVNGSGLPYSLEVGKGRMK